MTLYLTFEALATGRLKPNDLIVVSPHAASMAPSKLGLRPGETITVDDAMHAIAVHSANDMAVALAEKIGGSESRFAALMTLRAQELGMSNTHYVNASGLPDARQISTARDIATLSRAVMRDYPQYYHYFSIQQLRLPRPHDDQSQRPAGPHARRRRPEDRLHQRLRLQPRRLGGARQPPADRGGARRLVERRAATPTSTTCSTPASASCSASGARPEHHRRPEPV